MKMHGNKLIGMHDLRRQKAYLLAAWNGSSTLLASVADVVAGATPARSHELLEAPEESAKGRGRRGEIALALGGGEFLLGFVW